VHAGVLVAFEDALWDSYMRDGEAVWDLIQALAEAADAEPENPECHGLRHALTAAALASTVGRWFATAADPADARSRRLTLWWEPPASALPSGRCAWRADRPSHFRSPPSVSAGRRAARRGQP
jgi:hypothetical protein